ncbi:MAG: nucleoside hydrolase [Lunatimonas sp.]|uniref:nucleoside hydrolase n=1 Tax=Lunatimonas sp. TaxID=2060141 RepID=UPI00263AF6B5|nr:nucleoside hydrolase [Lunatimonas sp.]MCC5938240.1 nucleoside hydrolase [Lunatimonas sp.]
MQKITAFLAMLQFFGCSSPQSDQAKLSYVLPVKIILDTDMGSDCDDAGAFAVLHRYADLGMAEIIGCIFSSGKVPFGAGIVEAINTYYGRPDIPIGAYHGTDVGDPVDKMTAEKLARDTAAFKNRIIYNTDAEEQTRLNRRLLAVQEDHSITYVTIGHTKGLYDLLVSEPDDVSPLTGYELVSRKIDRWIAMGGVNANNEVREYFPDWNLFRNGTAAYSAYLIANFPRPAFFSDGGSQVMTGKSLLQTPGGNIVRTVYRDWLWNMFGHTLTDQRPSWDLIAVYFAVEGMGEFLKDTGTGRMEIAMDKGVRWMPDDSVNDRTLIQQVEHTDERFAAYLNNLLGATPKHYQE